MKNIVQSLQVDFEKATKRTSEDMFRTLKDLARANGLNTVIKLH